MAIVFVHGFIGSEKTWFRSDNQKFWPALMKGDPTFNGADIYVVTYPTSIGRKYFYPAMAADALQFQLDPILRDYDRIGFVAHSMGGLVIRDYLLDRPIEAAGKVAFIAYFSTPGKGSEVATLGKYFAESLAVDEMDPQTGTPYLLEQHNDWARSDFADVAAYCGAETQRTGPFHIVSPLSMTGLCPRNPVLGIDADHLGVVKPASTNDAPHQIVARAFTQQFGRLAPPLPPAAVHPPRTIALAADGRYEALVENEDRLLVRERQTETTRTIAAAAKIEWAAFTLDGREIYWTAARPRDAAGGGPLPSAVRAAEGSGPPLLWRARLANPEPEPITDLGAFDRVAISPDGRELAIVRWDLVQNIWRNPRLLIADRSGSEVARMPLPILTSEGGRISWSSDGDRIAIPGNNHIRIVSRRSMTTTEWPLQGYVTHATWSPTGDWLIAGANESSWMPQLWRIRPGQPPARITNDRHGYTAATFAGSDLFVQRRVELTGIWVADIESAEAPRRVATNAYAGTVGYRIGWTVDERIVFPSYVSDPAPRRWPADPAMDLVLVDPVTLRKERLSRAPADAQDPVVLADGRTVLFRCFSGETTLCRHAIGETGTRPVASPLLGWTIAANGIAWTTDQQTTVTLCRFDAATNALTPCTTFSSIAALSVQPLSERAALYGAGAGIWRMEAGKDPARIIDDCSVYGSALSPDGTRLIASCASGSKLLDVRNGAVLLDYGEELREPRWSPDGRRIAWIHDSSDEKQQRVRVANADGTNRVDIAFAEDGRRFAAPQWSRSGRYLAYTTRELRTEQHYIHDVE